MTFVLDRKKEKIARLGRKVLEVKEADSAKAAQKTVARLKSWFASIGSPVTLAAVDIPDADIGNIADNAANLSKLWGMGTYYTSEVIARILKEAR